MKPSETGRRWFVDPIDGTIAFTRGVGQYVNLLALEDERGDRPRGDQRSGHGRDRLRGQGPGMLLERRPPVM